MPRQSARLRIGSVGSCGKILHGGVTYEERGPVVSQARAQRRAVKMLRELRSLGYRIELVPVSAGTHFDRPPIFDPV
jgi:hypothetical protein